MIVGGAGAQKLMARVGVDTTEFEQKMAQLSSSADKAGKKTAASFSEASKTFVKASLVLGTLTAAIGWAVKGFSDFQVEMNAVKAVSTTTEEQMKRMSLTARELGAKTAFTAKEAAEGMKFLAMAGFDTEEVLEAIPATLNFASSCSFNLF